MEVRGKTYGKRDRLQMLPNLGIAFRDKIHVKQLVRAQDLHGRIVKNMIGHAYLLS